MARDQTKQLWQKALVAAGHTPKLDEDGELDMFTLDYDHHNGPGCTACGQTWCEHCRNPECLDARCTKEMPNENDTRD